MNTIIYRNFDEKLLKNWTEFWKNSPFANYVNSPYWFRTVVETFGYKNYVIIGIYQKEKLLAVAALIKTKKYGADFYTVLPSDFIGGIPFLFNPEDKKLIKILTNTFLDMGNVFLDNVPEQFIAKLLKVTPHGNRIYHDFNYILTIEHDTDGKVIIKNRKNLMKRAKNLESRFSLSSSYGYFSDMFHSVYIIDNNSKKKAKGYNTFSTERMKKFYENLAKNFGKYFFTTVLFFDKIPVAFRIGFLINKTFYASQIGYSDVYRAYSPGNVLLVKFVEQYGLKKIIKIDFGSGNNEFKRTISNHSNNFHKIILSRNILLRIYILLLYFCKDKLFNFMAKHDNLYTIYRNGTRKFRNI